MKKMLCIIFSWIFIFTGCNYKNQNSNYTIQTEAVEAVVINKLNCIHHLGGSTIDLEVKYQNYYGIICTNNKSLAVGSKIQVKLVKTYDDESIRKVYLEKLCY